MRRGMLDGSDIAVVSRECPGDGRNRIWKMTDKSARSIQTYQEVSRQRRTTTDEKGSLSSPFHGGDTGSNPVGDASHHSGMRGPPTRSFPTLPNNTGARG